MVVRVFREKGKFVTNVYWKKTFRGVYTNLSSFILETFKTGLIKSLLFRCFIFLSDFVKFSHKVNILKSILITAKISSRAVSKPYLTHQSKYILAKRFPVSNDVFVWTLKMLKAKRWKPKMLGKCKRYYFILLEPIKSVKKNKTCKGTKYWQNKKPDKNLLW